MKRETWKTYTKSDAQYLLNKKQLTQGLLAISPIPVIGEIAMYRFFNRALENMAIEETPRKIVSLCTTFLTRFHGIYPMYAGLYNALSQ